MGLVDLQNKKLRGNKIVIKISLYAKEEDIKNALEGIVLDLPKILKGDFDILKAGTPLVNYTVKKMYVKW